MRGVQVNKPSVPSNQWNPELEDFVCQLTSPQMSYSNHSQILDIKSAQVNVGRGCDKKLAVPSTHLQKDMKDTHASKSSRKEETTTKHSNRKIQDKKSAERKNVSYEIDEGICLSVDGMSSSSERKEYNVTVSCDSAVDTSDFELTAETRTGRVTFSCDSSSETSDSSDVNSEKKHKYTKIEKESKRSRIKRMITKPLRRSKSDCCEKSIPRHAMFLDSNNSKENDTMESRANDLSLCQKRLLGNSAVIKSPEERRLHKTCSADAAMMGSPEFNNTQPKSKSKKLALKNIKKRFTFLRRRNTDTELVPKSKSAQYAVPTYDQAFQWSRSFDTLLSDKNGLELFKGFLKSEFSEENLEFWIACEEFRFAVDSKLPIAAQKIYGDFVAFQAPKEVNLDSTTRTTTISSLENPSKDTFELAQHKIQALMEKDSYPRFIESELYQQLLDNVSSV